MVREAGRIARAQDRGPQEARARVAAGAAGRTIAPAAPPADARGDRGGANSSAGVGNGMFSDRESLKSVSGFPIFTREVAGTTRRYRSTLEVSDG
jgi:hypothetical protein